MKTFIAVLLLTACVAYAVDEEAFHEAVFQFLDERHDEKMAQVLRDNGLPEDTLPVTQDDDDYKKKRPPVWIRPCIYRGKLCWHLAGNNACKKLACIDKFFKCVIKRHPKPLPTLNPLQKGCVALLYLCRKHSPSCAGKLCCFVRIKRCFQAAKGE
ncbi:hypothetical protein ABFA07_019730 [Porites harrisoni]